ncbi:histone-lysine N-methyltransferase MLL2 [Cohnella sp. OV330]|nr:histone-lysine N-methyltransferase MLL2 [Cohnella sp. OV330]
MNKKTVLKAAGIFVAGLAGGIGLMMSSDAYKAINDALGNSTSNTIWQQNLAGQGALKQVQQQQAQVGKLVQDAETLKKQSDQAAQKKADEAAKKNEEAASAQQQQQEQMQQQMQQMIQQIQQMLQQMQQSQNETIKALTKA